MAENWELFLGWLSKQIEGGHDMAVMRQWAVHLRLLLGYKRFGCAWPRFVLE